MFSSLTTTVTLWVFVLSVCTGSAVPNHNVTSSEDLKLRANNDVYARCERHYEADAGGDRLLIWAKGWGNADSDSGNIISTHAANQFKGCGTLIAWSSSRGNGVTGSVFDNSNGDHAGELFPHDWHLDVYTTYAINDNCFGRAIASADGPEMKCEH